MATMPVACGVAAPRSILALEHRDAVLVKQVGQRLAGRQLARLGIGPEHVAPAPALRGDERPPAPAVTDGGAHEHVAAAQERARARAGLERLVGARERARAP